MHPAKSIILFTTISGMGYGLIISLLIFQIYVGHTLSFISYFLTFVVSMALVSGGLLSSTLHLGHPERAHFALTQWRSSWLSREGVFAILLYPVIAIYTLLFYLNPDNRSLDTLSIIIVLIAIATIFSTGKIYSSLRAIYSWNTELTTFNYLSIGGLTGLMLFQSLLLLMGYNLANIYYYLIILIILSCIGKILYWVRLDLNNTTTNKSTALGLKSQLQVNLLESPHDASNFLLKEMGYKVARKHSKKLRKIALLFAFILPLLTIFLSIALNFYHITILAFLFMIMGVFIERWLFFAEAKHSVMNYY
ncbi:MAG: dimethyl sulfoxide reductase anchor subunit [Rhizobiales bacterium]|jgi:DMSO reductase anchor subunit|nr:dimethyl sulfoxide reductase anchor subunit [Hyphomicrobiales bacterium]MBL6770482.1 dimethyl sulfoxide reductase anchor subunit [Hyphomicrobiales bacterium]